MTVGAWCVYVVVRSGALVRVVFVPFDCGLVVVVLGVVCVV